MDKTHGYVLGLLARLQLAGGGQRPRPIEIGQLRTRSRVPEPQLGSALEGLRELGLVVRSAPDCWELSGSGMELIRNQLEGPRR